MNTLKFKENQAQISDESMRTISNEVGNIKKKKKNF
jgi:hypothetical protein